MKKTANAYRPPIHGFVFGKSGNIDNNYITKSENMDGHIMVIGGVGSGKSSCIAMPTIRAWKSRIFTIDIKGELSNYANKYRANIKIFAPHNHNSYGYDPFAFLRDNKNSKNSRNLLQEVRAIAQAIIPLHAEIKDTFWIESAQTLLTGAILHYYTIGYNFIETLRETQQNGAKSLIETVSKSPNDKARLCMGGFVDMTEKTLSGVFGELSRHIISLATDDNIIAALSSNNTIEPVDLEYGYDVFYVYPNIFYVNGRIYYRLSSTNSCCFSNVATKRMLLSSRSNFQEKSGQSFQQIKAAFF
jgi:type IV secretion system protein VirD4